MSRYDFGAPGEEEFEPGSNGRVLRNKLGLTTETQVGQMESALLAVAQGRSYLKLQTDTPITVNLIRDPHRSWLASLYDFAGQIRTVNHRAPKEILRRTPSQLCHEVQAFGSFGARGS
jgi:cell filamentation protein